MCIACKRDVRTDVHNAIHRIVPNYAPACTVAKRAVGQSTVGVQAVVKRLQAYAQNMRRALLVATRC